MKSSKTSFLRNCISGWNVRFYYAQGDMYTYRRVFSIFVGLEIKIATSKYEENL